MYNRPVRLAIEDKVLEGMFHGARPPQVGRNVDVEVRDGEFQEYVITGFTSKVGESTIYHLIHPARTSNVKLFRYTPDPISLRNRVGSNG
jgi:hypothetical protein